MNGVAKYNASTTAGYSVSNNKISYHGAVTGADIITLTGLSTAASATDITVSDTTVILGEGALATNRTVAVSSGYTLALGGKVTVPVTQAAKWTVSNGTARYNTTTTAGYVVSNNRISYQNESTSSDIIAVTGLSGTARAVNLSLSENVVTVYASALAQGNTVRITSGYELALGANVTRPVTEAAKWTVSNGTAKYNATTSAGYVVNNNTITYQAARSNEDIITITGLSTTAKASDVTLNDNVITVAAHALTQNSTVRVSSGYELALAKDVTQPITSKPVWSVSGSTASYRTTSSAGYAVVNNTIVYQSATTNSASVTVSGLSTKARAADLSLKGSTVTVSANALAQNSTVRISSGYELALAKDVSKPATNKASWAVTDGVGSYRTTSSAGYVVSNNAIIYQAAFVNEDIITVTGLSNTAKASDLTLKSKTVTVAANALSASKSVEVNDGYKLALAKDVTVPAATAEGWVVTNGTAEYQTASKTAGYEVTNNKISYSAAILPNTLITLTGLKSKANPKYISLDNSTRTITIAASIVDKKNITVTDGYALNFAKGTYTGSTVTGSAALDTISAAGTGLQINSGAGNDIINLGNGTSKNTIIAGAGNDSIYSVKSKNIYLYDDGDGDDVISGFSENDTLKITNGTIEAWEVHNDDVTFKVGDGSITIKDGVGMKINIAGEGAKTKASAQIYESGWIYDSVKSSMTLDSGFSGSLDSRTYATSVVTIDASSSSSVNITGDSKNNVIIGGAGNDILHGGNSKNDTLTGGYGADVFVFGKNEGKDIVTDYSEEDTISIRSAAVASVSVSSSKKSQDVIFKVGTSGTLTVKDGAGKKITVIDSVGTSTQVYEKGAIYNADKTEVLFTEKFNGTLSSGIEIADGSSITTAQKIIGNVLDNSIAGGTKADTLGGGAGNDTLYGGKGADLFIYTAGHDVIEDYDAGERISLDASISGVTVNEGDVIFSTDNGSITVKDGAGKKITTITKVANKKVTETAIYDEGVKFNEKQTSVSLSADYEGSYIPDTKLKKLSTIDGSAATNNISISGSTSANVIIGGNGADTLYGGGRGNDTLTGGNGADIFVFGQSNGKDVIADYAAEDIIYLSSGNIDSASISGSDLVFKVGSGSLKVLKGTGTKITTQDSLGAVTTSIYEKNAVYDGDKTSVTFTGALKVTLDSSVATADGSAISGALKVVGNSLNNSIYGGSGNDTLYGEAGHDYLSGGKGNDTLVGGAGNDTMTGGDGKDVFVYDSGNDVITDYAAGDKIKFSTSFTYRYNGDDVIFRVGSGSLTVQGGAGKSITTVVGTKTTTQTYVAAKTADLFYDDNFISDAPNLDSITEDKVDITEIAPEEKDKIAQDSILAYSADK